ncbi:MAG: sporulation integral membrane protein YtvI [Oscillospiraceae bacterium]|nr:sporulation integral membrane protein YtvI [Oscillospiraceae bacterium]
MDPRTEKRRQFIINAAYWAVILSLLYFFFAHVVGWIFPVLIGLAVARLLQTPIRFLSRKSRIPRKAIAFVLVLFFIAVIGTLLWILGVKLYGMAYEQLSALQDYYNDSILPALKRIENWLAENLGDIFSDLNADGNGSDLLTWLSDFVRTMPNAFGTVFNWTARVPGFLLHVMFTILFSLFASVYYDDVIGFVMRQLPEKRQTMVRDSLSALKRTLVSYCGAYIKLSGITFLELLVFLSILRGSFSIIPALLIALVDILPVLGSGTAMFPWAVVHLITGNYYMAIGIMVVYLVIFVVRQIVEPKIVGDQLGLNPLLLIAAMYLGYLAMGLLGMIMLPIVVTIIVDLHRQGKIHVFK